MEKSIWEIKSKARDLSLISAVLDSSIDGIVALKALRNKKGEIEDFLYSVVNAKAAQLLRRDRKKLVDKTILQEFPGMKTQGVFDRYVAVVETGESMNSEIHFSFDDFDNWFKIIAVKLGDGIVTTFADLTQLKINEKKNRRNTSLIEKVFKNSSDSLVIFKPLRSTDGRIIDFEYILLNGEAEHLMKKPSGQIIGKTLTELYPAAQSRGVVDLYVNAFQDGKPFDVEFNFESEGQHNWFRQRGTRMENELLVITSDITRIKKAEKEITDRNKFILRIADSSPGLLYLFDLRSNKNLYINKKVEEILGYNPEHIKRMGNDFLESMIHPYDQALHTRHRKSIYKLKDREVLSIDYRLRHIQGRWIWFRVYETIFERDGDGLPIIVIGTAENISTRKESEDEMLKLKSLFDNSSDFVCITSMEGYVQYLNEAGKKLVAINGTDLRRTHILDYFLPRDREYVQSTILPQVRELGKWSGEINFRNFKTASPIPVSWSIFLVKDSNDSPIGIACVGRDVMTSRERANKLEESESKFRMLFEKSNDGIMLFERSKLIDCNESALRFLNAGSKDQAFALYIWDLSPTFQPDGRLSVEKAGEVIRKTIEEGPQKLEWTFRKLSGEFFTIEIILTPISMGTQQIIQLVWRSLILS